MKVCIISGRYPITEFQSPVNHKIYADKFNYSYIHCNWPTHSNNSYLNKVYFILSYIDYFDYLIWLDDDAFFFDFDHDIMDFAPTNQSFISICKSPSFKKLKTLFSSGQFIIKCSNLSKSFFFEVLKTDLKTVKEWWTEEMGYFTNGDQDIMIYLLLNHEKYKCKMDLHDYKCFNSRCENLQHIEIHKPLILHFTGRGKTKQKNYEMVQQNLNLHASLVENDILKHYNQMLIKDNYSIEIINKTKGKDFISRFILKLMKWLKH